MSTVDGHEGLSTVRRATYFTTGSSNTYVQPVSTTDLSDTPVITIATPLFARDGQRIAVLAAVLNLERLDRIVLQQTGLGESGETYLVGRRRPVRARADAGRVSRIPSPRRDRPGPSHQTDGRGPVRELPRRAGDRCLRDGCREIGSALLAEMSQDEAFAPARQLALTIGMIGLAVVALLGVGIYAVSRRIAGPILAITDTAAAVTAGDLAREAPVTTNDEVGDLADVVQRR